MTKAQVRIIEQRAVRRYKEELKSKVQATVMFIAVETILVAGVIYNLI